MTLFLDNISPSSYFGFSFPIMHNFGIFRDVLAKPLLRFDFGRGSFLRCQ